jgi:hypothetical protein
MPKAYTEDRFPAPRAPRKPKNEPRSTPDKNVPLMTEEVFFEDSRERSSSWGVHQQDEQN